MTDNEIALDVLNRLTVLKTKDSGAALDKISAEQQVTEKTRLGVVVIDQIDVLLEGEALDSSKSAQGTLLLLRLCSWERRRMTEELTNLVCTNRSSEPRRFHSSPHFSRKMPNLSSPHLRESPFLSFSSSSSQANNPVTYSVADQHPDPFFEHL